MPLARRRVTATLIAGALILVGSVACGDPTGIPDPGELDLGTFRAELTGAVERSLRGEAINYQTRLVGTREPAWWLRLSSPPGRGADSVRFEFMVKLARQGLPEPEIYPVIDRGIPRDSFRVQMSVDPESDGGGSVYEGRSGTVTLMEVVEGEVVAGRFEFRMTPSDSAGAPAVDVSGAFRSGR